MILEIVNSHGVSTYMTKDELLEDGFLEGCLDLLIKDTRESRDACPSLVIRTARTCKSPNCDTVMNSPEWYCDECEAESDGEG